LADAPDSKSGGAQTPCRFDSDLRQVLLGLPNCRADVSKRLTGVPKKGTFVPEMGTTQTTDSFSGILFGKARRAVLSLLFTHADQPYYIRQIVRIAGVGQGAVQRELRQLANAGIVTRAVRGRQVYYQANQHCPIFQELHSIVVKTVGLGDLLSSALRPLAARIKVAFVYGSMASAKEGSRSDVDILIVGNVSFGDIVSRLSPLQETLGREINPSVYSVTEFRQKFSQRNHFLRSVVETKKLFLIGDERELARVAK
jgi:uncharacterized protein